VVQDEAVVEHETRIVKCERLALMRGSGIDDLSDTHIFKLGTCLTCSLKKQTRERKAARRGVPLICDRDG
jgi:hypothetical protein